MRLDDPDVVRDDYASESRLLARRSLCAENGEAALRRHFRRVASHSVRGWVRFTDTAAARDYVASSIIYSHLADRVPDFDGPPRARRLNAVFVAEKL